MFALILLFDALAGLFVQDILGKQCAVALDHGQHRGSAQAIDRDPGFFSGAPGLAGDVDEHVGAFGRRDQFIGPQRSHEDSQSLQRPQPKRIQLDLVGDSRLFV